MRLSHGVPGPRLRTPWWIANEKVFHEFLYELVNQKSDAEDVFLRGKKLIQAAGLDFIILYEFYFLRKEDEQIFASHKGEFAKESGKQRATSSAAAVKMRRTRLVKEGVEMFGRGIRPVAGPEHAERGAGQRSDLRRTFAPGKRRSREIFSETCISI